MYTNIESSCCTRETNISQLYIHLSSSPATGQSPYTGQMGQKFSQRASSQMFSLLFTHIFKDSPRCLSLPEGQCSESNNRRPQRQRPQILKVRPQGAHLEASEGEDTLNREKTVLPSPSEPAAFCGVGHPLSVYLVTPRNANTRSQPGGSSQLQLDSLALPSVSQPQSAHL